MTIVVENKDSFHGKVELNCRKVKLWYWLLCLPDRGVRSVICVLSTKDQATCSMFISSQTSSGNLTSWYYNIQGNEANIVHIMNWKTKNTFSLNVTKFKILEFLLIAFKLILYFRSRPYWIPCGIHS